MSESETFPPAERLLEATDELVAIVRRQLPMRFYAGETWWSIFGSASLARMCDTVEALMSQLPARRDADAQDLLRSLYDQVVAFGWIAIDPDERHQRWIDDAGARMFELHGEGAAFGETVLTEDEVVVAEKAEPPAADDRAGGRGRRAVGKARAAHAHRRPGLAPASVPDDLPRRQRHDLRVLHLPRVTGGSSSTGRASTRCAGTR